MLVMGWIFTALLTVVVLTAVVLLALSAGDIRRYFEIKRM